MKNYAVMGIYINYITYNSPIGLLKRALMPPLYILKNMKKLKNLIAD